MTHENELLKSNQRLLEAILVEVKYITEIEARRFLLDHGQEAFDELLHGKSKMFKLLAYIKRQARGVKNNNDGY